VLGFPKRLVGLWNYRLAGALLIMSNDLSRAGDQQVVENSGPKKSDVFGAVMSAQARTCNDVLRQHVHDDVLLT
jgi:hypothetical protein